MGWGLIGALAGAGAAILFSPLTGGASLLGLGILASAGAGVGAGAGKIIGKVIGSSGDTPKNDLKKVGVNPEKLHEEAKFYREKRQEFLNEKNKESKDKIGKAEKKLTSLDESIQNLSSEIKNMPDGAEKNQKQALLNQKRDEKKKVEKEISDEQKKVDAREKEIDRVFQQLGNPVDYSQQQYESNANSPRWGSWKNWGIGIGGFIILILVIGFIKKLLAMVLGMFKG